MRYNPFRITPYLLKVQGTGTSGAEEEEPCCLALAERIISGYEGKVAASSQTAHITTGAARRAGTSKLQDTKHEFAFYMLIHTCLRCLCETLSLHSLWVVVVFFSLSHK